MRLGMVGLGRMGANMVQRLLRGGHSCVVYGLNSERVRALAREGARGAASLDELARNLDQPRAVWIMVPAGDPTEPTVMALSECMEPGDILIDGGNTYYKDDARRAQMLQERGIRYVDVGTSGGIWGAEHGYCLMIGGPAQAVQFLDPLFKTLAPGSGEITRTPNRSGSNSTAEHGYLYCGPAGAGHFIKMVHNGIEYGLMQAYAEGFDILVNAASSALPAEHRYDLNLAAIAEVWRHGSVISSWFLDLIAIALAEDPALSDYTGFVQDSGEGRWTIQAAIEEAIPAHVLSASLYARFRSRQEQSFAERLLSAMRHKFGGHVERPTGG